MKQSSNCRLDFLGWDRPLLPTAAVFLCDSLATGAEVDLSSLICVLPSARSAAKFEKLLRDQARQRGMDYLPPEIVTVGQLAERLYQPPLPIALELEQILAWARVLQSIQPTDLTPLIPVVPEQEPIGPWIDFGGTLRRLHEELAAHRLTFADVARATETESERRRWKLLQRIFAGYQAELAAAGLIDPHLARRDAVDCGRCRTDQTVALIGASDLSDAMIEMLRAVDAAVLALVAAPKSASDRFNWLGCVETAAWLDHQLPVTDHQFITADGIDDQAQAVAESITELAKTFPSGELTIGVTDESHVAPIEIELRGCGFPSYRNIGWTLAQTAVGRLLDLIATHLRWQSWQTLAALVRHGDVHQFVSQQLPSQQDQADWLTNLDQLLANHYPVRIGQPLPPAAASRYTLAVSVSQIIEIWLADFAQPNQTISACSRTLARGLQELYQRGSELSLGERTKSAVDAAQRVLERFAQLNSELDLPITGAAAMEMLAGRLSDVRIGTEMRPDDIEISGWLDLALDTSPALVVLGFNHPFVPAAVTGDPFLPGSLRGKLRIADNDRRYARDLYAAQLMVTTRSHARFIVGRTSAEGSPTPPSRLLAAAPPRDSARRIRQLLDSKRRTIATPHRWMGGPRHTDLPVPKLQWSETTNPITSISVTSFRDYLICPYRFYLRHVLGQRPLSDDGSELAANQFGDLIHNALDRFGQSADKNEADPDKIEACIKHHLHEYADQFYGNSATTAVAIQVRQAERRLKALAIEQATRIAEGWQIHCVETPVREEQAGIEVDGRRMGLRGRIDRIDYHPAKQLWAILDYKTNGDPPRKKHLQQTDDGVRWIDLQLPLYRKMAPFLGIDCKPSEVQLGYFNISQKDTETKINIADFEEGLMRRRTS